MFKYRQTITTSGAKNAKLIAIYDDSSITEDVAQINEPPPQPVTVMVDKNLQTEDTYRKIPKRKPCTQKLKKLPMGIVSPVFKYRCDFRKATKTNETSSKLKLADVIERY